MADGGNVKVYFEGDDKNLVKTAYSVKGTLEGVSAKALIIGGAIVTAMAGAVKGIVDITNASVKATASFEQLKGGVETLFKSDADAMMAYADNAFKTAGISANKYMELATSFSASMIKSLGGDTSKAVEMTDLAITDMSDNANKMGSDIQSIQNAYQGFAKQNYTMLDNLKLGYGGTKTEMERLIADANKLREAQGLAGDLSINSYADIVTAIHEVQTEMGITGTTAKESAETIEGSVNTAKASWENFLVALGTGENVSGAVDNLITSITTALKNIAPVIQTTLKSLASALPQIVDMVVELLPSLVETGVEIITSLITGILKAIPKLIKAVVSAIPTIINALGEALPEIVTTIVEVIPEILTAIVDAIPQIITSILSAIPKIIVAILGAIPQIIVAIVSAIPQIVVALAEALPQIITAVVELIPKLITAIVKAIPQIITAVVSAVPKIVVALVKAIPQIIGAIIGAIPDIVVAVVSAIPQIVLALIEAIPQIIVAVVQIFTEIIKTIVTSLGDIISKIKTWVTNLLPQLGTWGTSIKAKVSSIITAVLEFFRTLPSKMWNFLVQAATKVGTWVSNMRTKAVNGIANVVSGIISGFSSLPSRITTIGSNLISGLWNGINNKVSWVVSKIRGMGSRVLNAVKSIFGVHSPSTEFAYIGEMNMAGLEQGMVDEQSQVQRTIDGMFNLQPNVTPTMSVTQEQPNYIEEMRGMFNNMTIPVTIDARTDEGVILKVATNGIKEFQRANGRLPF